MFGKYLMGTVLFTFVVSGACAQPKYELGENRGANTNTERTSDEQKPADCAARFSASKYCLTWRWESVPTSSKAGSLIFKVWRNNTYDGSPVAVDFATVPELILWMPSMGHGSSPTSVTKLDVGTFRASNVFFVMPGEWELRFQVKDGKKVLDEALVPFAL